MRTALAVTLLALAGAAPSPAQGDSTDLHATLHAWADETWFAILDREGARGGRFSDQGILQRFHPSIDPDYEINKIRFRFGLLDDYDWYRHANGARCYAGSLTTTHFGEGCQFAQSVPLGKQWSANLHFDTADLLEVRRSLPRLGFTRTVESGFFLSIETTLVPFKPGTGLEVGAGWRRPGRELAIFVGMLDAFSNYIYGGLGLEGAEASDSAQNYERQPFTFRLNLDQSLGNAWRVEARTGVMVPATVRSYLRYSPESGFRQNEAYGFGGLVVEYRPIPRLTVGGFATYVRAVTDRSPLRDGPPVDDFRLTERTSQAGALALARVGSNWVVTSWFGRNWRPQRKVYRTGAAPDVDYEDVAWSGQLALEYRPQKGFAGSIAWDFDQRDIVRGAGALPAPADAPSGRHNSEIRSEFGWRAANRYSFEMGLAIDTDPGMYARGWFGGGEGRFILYW